MCVSVRPTAALEKGLKMLRNLQRGVGGKTPTHLVRGLKKGGNATKYNRGRGDRNVQSRSFLAYAPYVSYH